MMLQIGDKVDLSLKGCEVVGVNRSHDGKQLVYSVVTPKGWANGKIHVWNIGEDSLPEAMVIKDVS
jgi:putative lipase involved disintegration of autophagic bodies